MIKSASKVFGRTQLWRSSRSSQLIWKKTHEWGQEKIWRQVGHSWGNRQGRWLLWQHVWEWRLEPGLTGRINPMCSEVTHKCNINFTYKTSLHDKHLIFIRIWEGSHNIIPLHETQRWNEGCSASLGTCAVGSSAVPEIFVMKNEGLL